MHPAERFPTCGRDECALETINSFQIISRKGVRWRRPGQNLPISARLRHARTPPGRPVSMDDIAGRGSVSSRPPVIDQTSHSVDLQRIAFGQILAF